MRMEIIKKIPSAEELIQEFPLSTNNLSQILRDRKEVKNILAGKDKRMIVITGPCSAWPSPAVLEYGKRLKRLSNELEGKLKLVLRVYIQKPRTTKGWTGPVNQPNPLESSDIEKGSKYSRSLMVKLIGMGIPIADELLFTHNERGFTELLSWVAIGARSAEDQEHRIFASALECPAGMKNPTSGNVEIAINNVIAAQHSHTSVFYGNQVLTHGNDYAHLVLRGGSTGPNYHVEDIQKAVSLMTINNVKNPSIIIDASHDNCKVHGEKDEKQQINVIREVVNNLKIYKDLRSVVKGFMLESYIKSGNQKVVEGMNEEDIDKEGLSITDPCLSWEDTEVLLRDLASNI